MANETHDINEIKRRMHGASTVLKAELSGLRTGRASAHLLDPVIVEAYGAQMPLQQCASVTIPEPRMISVNVWDRTLVHAVEKAIVNSNLGLSPATVGAIGGIAGAGVLVGALIASRAAKAFGVGPTIVGSIGLGGIVGPLVPLAPQNGTAFWFLAVAFFATGVSGVVYNVNQVSLRQAITPERFLGRMNATMRFLVWGTIPIGSLIGAGLSEVIGVHATIWVGAILGLFAFLPVLLSPVRSLREIPSEDRQFRRLLFNPVIREIAA